MKPKAPKWLRLAFRDGVDERTLAEQLPKLPAYHGAERFCWLSYHDPKQRPCIGTFERFHFVSRQRIEHALGALLPWGAAGTEEWNHFADLMLLAAWDPRIGATACHGHHRRLDSALTPTLTVPRSALPDHVEDWAADYGLEHELDRKFA